MYILFTLCFLGRSYKRFIFQYAQIFSTFLVLSILICFKVSILSLKCLTVHNSLIFRIVEVSFTFTAVISVGQVALELTRCLFMSTTQDTFMAKFFATVVYMVTFAT